MSAEDVDKFWTLSDQGLRPHLAGGGANRYSLDRLIYHAHTNHNGIHWGLDWGDKSSWTLGGPRVTFELFIDLASKGKESK